MAIQAEQNAALTAQWQQQISMWQRSGLTQAGFCKKHKLIYHRFGYWYRKLNRDGKKEKNESAFARVVPQSIRPASPGLTVRLPNGMELRGVDQDNLPVVHQLLRQWS